MKNFSSRNSAIHIIVRALLMQGEEIILCRERNSKAFFLPGGHVEDGESFTSALLRELHEELGEANYKVTSFIGVCENIFPLEDKTFQHEVNIVFKVEISTDTIISSKEEHIEFVSIGREELKDCILLPESLKEGLLDWLKSGVVFLKEIK